jgi:hypothetical protein
MENFKQIVYRNEDEALVIIPQSDDLEINVNFLGEIDADKANKLNTLKSLCIEKIPQDSVLKYVVAEKGTNILNIEHSIGVVSLDITTLAQDKQLIVSDAIKACIRILNNL